MLTRGGNVFLRVVVTGFGVFIQYHFHLASVSWFESSF